MNHATKRWVIHQQDMARSAHWLGQHVGDPQFKKWYQEEQAIASLRARTFYQQARREG